MALTELVGDAEGGHENSESFPKFKLQAKHLTQEQYTDCRICWDDYEVGQCVMTLPCSHVFHNKCINKWLKVSGYCVLFTAQFNKSGCSFRILSLSYLLEVIAKLCLQCPKNWPKKSEETSAFSH